MRVGFIGLGRLGLPIAAVLSQHHRVTGYDPDPSTAQRLKIGHPWETGLEEFLNDRIALADSIDSATYDADVVVVCVQTPHEPMLDGTHDTDKRAPFDLSYVKAALAEIPVDKPVVLMSTVLPGDCRSLGRDNLVYAPAFPAMGSTVSDFLNPEFVMIGVSDAEAEVRLTIELLARAYGHLEHIHWHIETYETAELTKMAYNTAIGLKIGLANTVGWLAESVGADGEATMRILSQATRRIVSSAYMMPGLGDGGACHPRDQIALSWLAQQHGVFDLFGALIDQRSAHSKWIADVTLAVADDHGFSSDHIVILGAAYKANSTLVDGSPAVLLANQTGWPVVERPPSEPAVIVVGVPHDVYKTTDFTSHVVVDPWGIVEGAYWPGRASGPIR